MACVKRSRPTRPESSRVDSDLGLAKRPCLTCRSDSKAEIARLLPPITGADVSVVIPARNEQERLPECLRRLQLQTLAGFEIIVVDSASTDATSDVAAAAGARVLRVDRPGVGLARQTGFDAARRAIIVSTDADALPASDWLERLVAPLQRSVDRLCIRNDPALGERTACRHRPCALPRIPAGESPRRTPDLLRPQLRGAGRGVPRRRRVCRGERATQRGRRRPLGHEAPLNRTRRLPSASRNGRLRAQLRRQEGRCLHRAQRARLLPRVLVSQTACSLSLGDVERRPLPHQRSLCRRGVLQRSAHAAPAAAARRPAVTAGTTIVPPTSRSRPMSHGKTMLPVHEATAIAPNRLPVSSKRCEYAVTTLG